MNKKEGSTARNAVSRFVSAENIAAIACKRGPKKRDQKKRTRRKSQRVCEESLSCLSTCFIVS